MERHFKQRRKQMINLFGWWKRKTPTDKVNIRADKKCGDVCPECNGEGYSVNDNHYLSDNDYEKNYSCCRRCNGTGRYRSNIDSY